MSVKRQPRCEWCGKELVESPRGRRKKYCSQSCRQRAYEQRQNVQGTTIPASAVIMRPESVAAMRDKLFELRCLAEDIATASKEGADFSELDPLCQELVVLARDIEKIR
ncbi:hypothetical protein PAB09_06855 [Corynebacterium sp. SCR221107]|uniref:hypothetical protein n=1 Tax=Corynebacterium sp. SCR221107 TaxID=3017361 RepID=UPI0022EC1F96|nr:hypothetical protein [Corynebacterium sp. SCR221107]WBT07667.1 hypothetical protein PAB09_06855 [Corynebacterium sp. SCR221107]